MNITQNKWLIRLGAIFLFASLFLVCFYVTFPFDLVQNKMVRAFEKETGCKATPKDQTVRVLLRFQWHNVSVLCPNTAPLIIASIEAKLAILPMLFKQGEIAFKIKMADGGSLSGTLVADKTPTGIAFSMKKEGEGVDVHVIYRGFSGILNTKGVGRWMGQDILLGTGAFNVNFKEAHFRNPALPGPMGDISFATMTGKVSWEAGVLSIKDFSAEGENAALTSSKGSLIIHQPFAESFISIALDVSPKGQIKQVAEIMIPGYSGKEPLKLEITGALTRPKVLLNGRRLPI